MAISLKNVDDRLKVVEAKILPAYTPKLIWSGTKRTSLTLEEIGKYNAFIANTGYYGACVFGFRGVDGCGIFEDTSESRYQAAWMTISGNTITFKRTGTTSWFSGFTQLWTIGYLISYRILNYAYAYVKSLRDFKAIIKSHSFCKLLSKFSREVI